MPLPDAARRNGHFERGQNSLGAFGHQGRIGVVDRIRTRPPRRDVIAMDAVSANFVAINNPHDTDVGGVPIGTAADTSAYGYPNPDLLNSFTYATTGAWLEIKNVEFRPGERLRFQWNFLPFEELRSRNDFSLLVVEHAGIEVFRKILAEVRRVPSRLNGGNSPVLHTGWQVYVFSPEGEPGPDWDGRSPPGAGTYTLRWVASNGIVGPAGVPPSDPDPNADPSPLLLDAIEMDSLATARRSARRRKPA